MKWISVKDRPPEKNCLVYVEKTRGCRFHVANIHENISVVGGHFAFDQPKITHWMPLPEPPE